MVFYIFQGPSTDRFLTMYLHFYLVIVNDITLKILVFYMH